VKEDLLMGGGIVDMRAGMRDNMMEGVGRAVEKRAFLYDMCNSR